MPESVGGREARATKGEGSRFLLRFILVGVGGKGSKRLVWVGVVLCVPVVLHVVLRDRLRLLDGPL